MSDEPPKLTLEKGNNPGLDRPMTAAEIRVAARRERVAGMLARRLKGHEMAQALNVSERTIDSDVAAIKAEMASDLAAAGVLDVATDFQRKSQARERQLWLLVQDLSGHGTAEQQAAVRQHNAGKILAVLRELRFNAVEEVKALQSLGVYARAPDEMLFDMRIFGALGKLPPEVWREVAAAPESDFIQVLGKYVDQSVIAEVMQLGPGQEPPPSVPVPAEVYDTPAEPTEETTTE